MSGRPHVHHLKQTALPRAADDHAHEINRQAPFVGDLPHCQSGGDVFGDASDDIVRMMIPMMVSIRSGRNRRTTHAMPSTRGHAVPRHARHHTNRSNWKETTAITYATDRLSSTERAATFAPNCRLISATVAKHGV